MRWRHRKRLLAALQGAFALALVPTFAALAWAIGDGPAALAALGFASPLPSLSLTNASGVIVFVGLFLAMTRVTRMVDSMRALAIDGDTQIIPPAIIPAPVDLASLALPITLVRRPTWRRRIGMLIGFLLSLAVWLGLTAVTVWASLFAIGDPLPDGLTWLVIGVMLAGVVGPLFFLRAALQRSHGVVADSLGVTEWGGHRAIAWADARLLEIGSRRGATLYTLYAADGRSLTWTSGSNDPLYITTNKPGGSGATDSSHQAEAILALAKAHAGLIPRTFDIRIVDRASNLASEARLPFGNKTLPGMWYGNVTAMLGVTLGAGLATLSMRSPAPPSLTVVCFVTLAASTLWSLVLTFREALLAPTYRPRAELPDWRASSALGAAQVQQSRIRSRKLAMTTRAALLLAGAIAGMTIIITALAAGQIAVSLFDAWSCLLWLGCVALFGLVRVWGFFSADRVRLLAADDGLHDLSKPASQPIPWADIATLRYTWTRATGYSFTATAARGEEFSWASQSRLWRDEPPDLAASGVQASAVDGDAFAAMVAAYTGLTPAQELG